MSDELILYTNPQSRGMIARWMLEEVGVPLFSAARRACFPARTLLKVKRRG